MKQGALLLALLLVLLLSLFACLPWFSIPPMRMDPARMAEDPAAFRGDDWDRRAASLIDASRGTDLLRLVSEPGTEREVVDTLRATSANAGDREALRARSPDRAPGVLLIRRARAAYAAAADAMASDDATSRRWGIGTFEVVESRHRGGPSSEDPGPPYEGLERDVAITAVARILTSDPERGLRMRAVLLMRDMLPDHDEPSAEAIAEALAREEEDDEARTWLLWLLATRKAPAPLILDAAMHGYLDPVVVSVGIYGLFGEENRELLEKAYGEGDAIGRAGIGETFYRHQSPMPWAEALILKGLSDPDLDVRARFAKGTLVLRPFNATVRARLTAMADDVSNAAWALSVEEEEK